MASDLNPPAKDYPILLTREQGFGMQVGETGGTTESRLCAVKQARAGGKGLARYSDYSG